ncbi:MAG: aldo/keto reductase [Eubacterium sp.]|nr:aldo/keto reductase [Eubacterium sp.]
MFQEPIPSLLLPHDQALPLAGLGLYRILDDDTMETAVHAALSAGIRMFDTASFYKNEDILGDVLSDCSVPRSELFITTKIWNTAQRLGDVRGSVERSLERLGLDYIDLYLIHWPVPGCFSRTWREMIRLQEEGLIRSIGVSNFEIYHLEQLEQASDVPPAVNQIECHPLWRREKLVSYCQQKGIAVQAYAPLAQGLYQSRPILQKIGAQHCKTAAQIGLRWLIQRDISVIPKSANPDRIYENSALFDFKLTEAEMQAIDQMDEHYRSITVPEDISVSEWEM